MEIQERIFEKICLISRFTVLFICILIYIKITINGKLRIKNLSLIFKIFNNLIYSSGICIEWNVFSRQISRQKGRHSVEEKIYTIEKMDDGRTRYIKGRTTRGKVSNRL